MRLVWVRECCQTSDQDLPAVSMAGWSEMSGRMQGARENARAKCSERLGFLHVSKLMVNDCQGGAE